MTAPVGLYSPRMVASGLVRSISTDVVDWSKPTLPARSVTFTRRKARFGLPFVVQAYWPVLGNGVGEIGSHGPSAFSAYSRVTGRSPRNGSFALQRTIIVSRRFGSGVGS